MGTSWVPVDKQIGEWLPKVTDGPFNLIEAYLSVLLDYDNGKSVTVAGYATRWGWSRKRVKTFLRKSGVVIVYPEDSRKKQNQRGQITIQKRDSKGADRNQISLIDSKWLGDEEDRKGAEREQKGGRKGSTTNNPNPNPNPNPTEGQLSHVTPSPKKDSRSKKKIYEAGSEEMRLAQHLYDLIQIDDPKAKEPCWQKWATVMDKIMRIDKRPFEEITAVMKYAHNVDGTNDGFWIANIRSPASLRKKYGTLRSQMESHYRKNRSIHDQLMEANYENNTITIKEDSHEHQNKRIDCKNIVPYPS